MFNLVISLSEFRGLLATTKRGVIRAFIRQIHCIVLHCMLRA